MSKLRDQIVIAALFSAAEAYILLHFYPHLKPTGGLGRLAEWFLLLNLFLLVTHRWFLYPFFFSPLRKIPGPSGGNFLWGHGPAQFSKPPGESYKTWVNAIPNEGLLRLRGFFNRDTLIPTTPEMLKTVLSDNSYDYEKPAPFVKILRTILGDGLILVEGNVHKFQRKHLLPSFQVQHIRDLYPMFWAKSCELVDTIAPEGQVEGASTEFEVEFGQWCMRATLDIIGIAGFGRDFGALHNPMDELVEQYSRVLEPSPEKLRFFAMNVLVPQWLLRFIPSQIGRDLDGIQNYLHQFALNMVKERRAELANVEKTSGNSTKQISSAASLRNDILSLLVLSNDFTDHELAEQVLTMMAAGHETTSSTLSWTAYLLALHPTLQSRLRHEVRTAIPTPTTLITAAIIDSLPLLTATCLETLRLYPTVPVTVRDVVRPTPLGPHIVPTGTAVLLVPWAINRSHAFWGTDAEQFLPEQRWINADGHSINKSGGATSNYAQMTFLHGNRSCIGQGFAVAELKCLVAALVARFEIHLARAPEAYFPAGLVTTKPVGGMWLRLKRVEGW